VKGATFKENVSDIRNSKVADVVKALKSYYVNVDVEDPSCRFDELKHEYGFGLAEKTGNDYDAVIITVPHKDYLEHDDDYFTGITKSHGLGCRPERTLQETKLPTELTGVCEKIINFRR
jgi:UDP-N-acetyl-D-galactosamine dehydrogenase